MPEPMTQPSSPDIDVTITPALRALVAGRSIGHMAAVARKTPRNGPPTSPAQAALQTLPMMQKHRLRRDGQRPLLIDGMRVIAQSAQLPLGDIVLEQRVAVYLDATDNAYLALALVVPSEVAAHSIFDAGLMSSSRPAEFVSAWSAKANAVIASLTATSPHPDLRHPVHGAQGSLSSLCLQPELLLNERILS